MIAKLEEGNGAAFTVQSFLRGCVTFERQSGEPQVNGAAAHWWRRRNCERNV